MENHYITYTDVNLEKREVKVFVDGETVTVGLSDYESESFPPSGDIDDFSFDLLKHFETKLKCMKKAVKALSYSALNSFKLKQKLSKEFPKDIVDDIVESLASRKYIDDEYLASRAAESCCYGKLYGPKRIRMELRTKGYKTHEIEDALSEIPQEDYYSNMSKLQNKKMRSLENDDEKIEFLRGLFFKYGYTDSQIYEFLQFYR